MIISAEAVPPAIAFKSVWRVDAAKRITAVVNSFVDLTSIIGITEASAAEVFALASSVTVRDFATITLSKTFVINASSSISTLDEEEAYSISTSSEIALK